MAGTVKHAVGAGLRRVGVDPRQVRRRFRRDAPAAWYDDVYADSVDYAAHYSESTYLPVWEKVARRIIPPGRVLDVGCGPGQLAHLLHDGGLTPERYGGFDLSAVAIDAARKRLPGFHFAVDDAFSTNVFDEGYYTTVVCTEVLEHVRYDLDLLERVRRGTQVVATVPDFESEAHLRWFRSEHAVRRRYRAVLDDLNVTTVSGAGWRIFVMDGFARG